jgi:hypothetical protein
VPAVNVRGHAEFFDDLVELVPAKFYVPTLQNEEWMVINHSASRIITKYLIIRYIWRAVWSSRHYFSIKPWRIGRRLYKV